MKRLIIPMLVFTILAGLIIYLILWHRLDNSGRDELVREFLHAPQEHTNWMVISGTRCNDAPFQIPTTGFIGYLWNDSFRIGHRHQGVDIFSGAEPGVAPIYAAFDGFLTRLPDWHSSVIIRVPSDPLHPGQEIWLYYTHMADPQGNSFVSNEFPAGSSEVPVSAGTLLGYQGNYSGTPGNPVGVHLHISIVLPDENGGFRNELQYANTLDPSPYFGLPLNGSINQGEIPLCIDAIPSP